MFRIFFFQVLCILFALPGVVRDAGATSVVRFAFDTLCVRAETIAHVRCVDASSLVDDRGRIVTRTRFEVLSVVKGEPGAEIVLTLPGGSADGRRTVVPGIPRFTPGEEVVLFLTGPGASGSPWPLGLGQGCYRARTVDGGETQVTLQADVTPLPDGPLFKPVSHRPFNVSLQNFLHKVRQTLASPSDER